MKKEKIYCSECNKFLFEIDDEIIMTSDDPCCAVLFYCNKECEF